MNRDEFGRAVLEHKDRVHSYASWLLGSPEDARDVTQESLLRLWEHRSRVQNGSTRTWLLRTAHNLCLDRLRRDSARPQHVADDFDRVPAGTGDSPEHSARRAEMREGIGKALALLSPRDRAVILMREMHGLSYAEMSHVLGLRIGALKVALHRARERLRNELIDAGVTP